ncbi:MAG: hypothetical protein PHE53_09555 [Thermoguttaceae bacterium]|nr:hypothetical protein [Thermoguttaceae bacterium]
MLNEPVSSYSLIPRLRAEEISPSESLQPNTEPGNLPNSRIPLFSTPGFDPYGIHSPYFSGDPLAPTSSPMSPQMPPFDSNARESVLWNAPSGTNSRMNVPHLLPDAPSENNGPSVNRSEDAVQQFLRADPMGTAASGPVTLPEKHQLQFRRIHFPVDRPELLRETGMQLVPMGRKEFDQLMRPMTLSDDQVGETSTAHVTQSFWRATFDTTTGSLHGTVVWNVDAQHGTSQFLPMDPCRPAIRELIFVPDAIPPVATATTNTPVPVDSATPVDSAALTDSATAANTVADSVSPAGSTTAGNAGDANTNAVGDTVAESANESSNAANPTVNAASQMPNTAETRVAWGRDRKGRLGVLVDGPGTLRAEWTLCPDAVSRGTPGDPQTTPLAFRWEVPVTLSGELILALPASLTPEFPEAIVQFLSENAEEIGDPSNFLHSLPMKEETGESSSRATDLAAANAAPANAVADSNATTNSIRSEATGASGTLGAAEPLRYWRILFPNNVPSPSPFELSTPASQPISSATSTPSSTVDDIRDISKDSNPANASTVEPLPTVPSGQDSTDSNRAAPSTSFEKTSVPPSYLRIVSNTMAKTRLPLGVRQWTTCMVSRQNIEIQKVFTAIPQPSQRAVSSDVDTAYPQEIRGVFPETLVLCFPKKVQITDVRIGDTLLRYEDETDERKANGQINTDGASSATESGDSEWSQNIRRLRLSIPGTLAGVGTLRVNASYPLTTASSSDNLGDSIDSASLILPDIWLDDVFQESSMVSLLVPEPLVLESLVVDDGRQVFCSPITIPITGRSYGIQLFSPQSQIQFRLGSPTVSFFASSGTTVTFDGLSIRTLTVAECRVPEGEKFDIRLPLAAGWTIESVTTEEPDALRDWTVGPASNRGTSELLIQFRRPLQSGLPLTLRIAARGPQAQIDSHWRGDELLPFLFPSSEADTWIAVRTNPVCQWRSLETTSMPRTPWGRVSESLRKLFPQPVGSLQAYADIADHLFVLEQPSDDYVVDQKVTASLVGQSLQQRVELRVLTRSPGIDHLRVRYRDPQASPPIWHVVLTQPMDETSDTVDPMSGKSANNAAITTETVSVVPIGGMVPIETPAPISMDINRSPANSVQMKREGYTTWELRFTQPIENSFMLCEQRVVPLDTPQEVLCVNVLTANRQTGQLTLRRPFGTAFRNHQFEALPQFSGDSTFSFDPDSLSTMSTEPVFTFMPPESQRVASTTIRGWESRLEVRVDSNATVRTLASWKIENEGAEELTIRLPSSWKPSDVESICVNGRMIEPIWAGATALRVRLPRNVRFLTVSILCTARAASSFHSLVATPEMPYAEIPILRRVQQVSIPAEYQLVSVTGGQYTTSQESRLSIMQRFFGISARPESEPRFSLFSWDWFHERDWFPDTQTSGETSKRWLSQLSETLDTRFAAAQNAQNPDYLPVDTSGHVQSNNVTSDTTGPSAGGATNDTFGSNPTQPNPTTTLATDFNGTADATNGVADGAAASRTTNGTTTSRAITTAAGLTADTTAGASGGLSPAVRFSPLTWGELLNAATMAAERPTVSANSSAKSVEGSAERSETKTNESSGTTSGTPLVVLVDRIALGEIGISPHQRVEFPAGWESSATLPQSASSRGSSLLQHAGMVLLVRDRTLLLTSAQRAAFGSQELTSVEGMNAWMILPGEFTDRLRNGMSGRDLEWIPLTVWTRLPPLSTSPWQYPDRIRDSDIMISGHHFFSAERLDDQPLTIVAYHRYFLLGIEICCLLAFWSGLLCFPMLLAKLRQTGRWTRRIPRRWRVFLTPETLRPRLRIAVHLTFLATMMIMLLLVPETLVGVFRGTLWGSLAALWMLRQRRSGTPTPPALPTDSPKPTPPHTHPLFYPIGPNAEGSETRTFASMEPDYHDLMELPISPSQNMDSTQDYCTAPQEVGPITEAVTTIQADAVTNGENHETTVPQTMLETTSETTQETTTRSTSEPIESEGPEMTTSPHSENPQKTPHTPGQTWLSILLCLSLCGYSIGLCRDLGGIRWAMGATSPVAMPQETVPATTPTETAPTETTPETTPATAETAPATTAPETTPATAETAPATTAPETTPTETAPATTAPETTPTETVPAETAPAETTPAPAETAPETTPTEAAPAATPAEATTPEATPAKTPQETNPEAVKQETKGVKPEEPALIPSGFDEEPTGFSIPVTRLSPEIGRLLMGISLPKDGVIPIFVPTDERYQPAGEQIYVPLDFYSVLQQQTESSKQVIDGWQLLDATYQMQLMTQPDTQLCIAENFLAIFEFSVVEPDCMLTIPLGGTSWTPQINRLRLDGEPVKGSWVIRDAMLMVPVTKTGHCVLEVPMQMEPVERLGRLVVSGRIPPIPDATFDLEISDSRGVHFEIPTASGEQTSEGQGRLRWTLGSTDRLEWSWAKCVSSLETTNTEAELDEIQFLRITDSSVETDVVWKFRKLSSPLTCFELECPLDMEMVSLSSAREIGRFTRTSRGYLCSFSEAIDPESAITATLQKVVSPQTVISGIGQLRPTKMNIRSVRTTSRLLVIGASPELEVELPNEPPRQNLNTTVSSPSPAFASMTLCGVYDRNTLPDDFTMIVRAKPGLTHVEQRSVYICQKDRVQIEMNAKVQVRSGTIFQYRIDAPAEMEIESIQLLDNRAPQPMRWARTPTGTITLFPDAPVSDRQEIVLHGWLHVDCPGEWTVPTIRVAGDSRTPDLLEIFRRESIRVAIRSFAGLTPTDAVLTTPVAPDAVSNGGDTTGTTPTTTSLTAGRLVAAYQEVVKAPQAEGTAVEGTAESMKLVLAFELNTPRLIGTTWSWLRPVATGEMVPPESMGTMPRRPAEIPRGGNEFPPSPERISNLPPPNGGSAIDTTMGSGGGNQPSMTEDNRGNLPFSELNRPELPAGGGPAGGATGRGASRSGNAGSEAGMSGEQGSTASLVPSLWRLNLLVDVQVDSGVMDTFRIPLPTSWVGPFVCSPSMSIELNENVSTGARYLYVRPTTPVSGQVQFTVTGTLVSRNPRGIPRLPVIRLERGESVVSQAVVPNRYANRDIRWSLPASADRVLPSNIAENLGISAETVSQYRTMLIPDEMSSSSLITATRRLLRRPPRLPLAELSFSWFEDGSIQGRAAYLIEPGGRTEAELTLPPHAELIAVSVADSVVLAEGLPGNRIRFPFGPPDLPQCVTILWKQNAIDANAQSPMTLTAPIWKDFQAERVFWQILAPPGKKMRTPPELQVVRYSEQPLFLLEQMTSILEIGTDVLQDDPAEAINWVVVWMNDWDRTELWFRHNIVMEPLSTQVQLQYDSLRKRRDAILARFPEAAARLAKVAGNPQQVSGIDFARQGTAGATNRMGNSPGNGASLNPEIPIRGYGAGSAGYGASGATSERDSVFAARFGDSAESFALSPDPTRLRMVSLLELGEVRPMLLCAISTGSVQQVEIRYSQIQDESESGAWFIFLLIFGMVGVAGYLFWRPNTPVRPRVKNEPIRTVYRDALILCLVGIFVWSWLRPGMLGAILVGAAILQGMNVWRQRRVIRAAPHVPRDE